MSAPGHLTRGAEAFSIGVSSRTRVMVQNASRQPVYRESAEAVSISALPGAHCRMQLHSPQIAASIRPGQFVNVSPPLGTALLRRPLGVYRTVDGSCIELVFKLVGRGTEALAKVRPGEKVDVIGPLGNGFELGGRPPETAILVAGGFGTAPLFPLAAALRGKVRRTYLFVGTEEDLPLEVSDSSMHASFVDPDVNVTLTDFEAIGVVARAASQRERKGFYPGFVTDLLEKLLHHKAPLGEAKLYACGPWPMMKKTAEIAVEHQIACDVLLEERMGCGIGACMSCVVRVVTPDGRPEYVRACVEGPVLNAADVDWEVR